MERKRMKKSPIYTRSGDKGMTSLVGGIRVRKTHPRLEAYGTVDELNAQIGMLVTVLSDEQDKALLRFVQCQLFSLGAYLATDFEVSKIKADCRIEAKHIERLEYAIDEADHSLPPLKAFVLPGGAFAATLCHVCRTVCRRAERRIFALEESEICEIDENVKRFMNRLSDYFFVLSRKLNELTHEREFYWDKNCE